MVPVVEHRAGEFRTGVEVVLADEFVQFLAVAAVVHEVDFNHVHVAEVVEVAVLVPHIGHATAHSGCKVASCFAENHHTSAGHILAAVVARAFNHGRGSRVAHSETLAHLSVDIQFAACCAIKSGVSGDDVVLCREIAAYRGQYGYASTRQSLGEIVVGLALEFEVYSGYEERSEALSGRTFELHVHCLVGQTGLAVFRGNHTAEHRSCRAVGILYCEVEVNLILALYGALCPAYELLVEHVAELVHLLCSVVQRALRRFFVEHAAEIEQRGFGAYSVFLCNDKFGVAHDVVETCEAHFGKIFAHLTGEEREIVHQIVGLSTEILTQFGVLRCHTHGAGIEVALAHHHTSEHNQCRRSETEFLCSEHSHEHYVAACLELAVYLKPNLTAQTIFHECLLCFGKTNLGRYSGETHARCRRSTRSALGTRNHNEVGLGLGHACGYCSHSALGNEFHADSRLRIDVFKVEYELCKVFN